MATQYWVGDGATQLWSTPGCWANVSGGAGGSGAVPIAGDNVIFDANSHQNCHLDIAATPVLGTVDFTGWLQGFFIDAANNTLRVGGTVFTLSAAQAWNMPLGAGIVSLEATAGTVLVTTAGKDIGNLKIGAGGAGGTFQLQDPLGISVDLLHVNGTFQTNNQVLNVNHDISLQSGLAAGAFQLGSSTITIGRRLNLVNCTGTNPVTEGTSQVIFSGTYDGTAQLDMVTGGNSSFINFYNLNVSPGIVFTHNPGTFSSVTIKNQWTVGAGASVLGGVNNTDYQRLIVASTLANACNFAASATIAVTMTWSTTANVTAQVPNCSWAPTGTTATGGLVLQQAAPASATIWQLQGNTTVTGHLILDPGGWTNGNPRLDLNGFNLTVTGDFYNARSTNNSSHSIIVGNKTLTVGGNFQQTGGGSAFSGFMPVITIGATGSFLIGGNTTFTTGGPVPACTITMTTGGLIAVGGNWTSTGFTVTFTNLTGGTVNFTKLGAFTIACDLYVVWPIVSITGGGIVTTPLGWNVYDLVATNAVITQSTPVTVRHNYTVGGSGTVNINAELLLGSTFATLPGATVNYGTAGIVDPLNGGLTLDLQTVLSKFNVSPELSRLQIVRSCTITNLILENRFTPLVIQMLAGGTLTVPTLTNLIGWPEAPVQLISSTPGTTYNLNVTAFTSTYNLWPRDTKFTGAVITGDLSNRSLGNNSGGSFNSDGQMRGITDDPGWNDLSGVNIDTMEYCWLVSTTLLGLTALAAAFASGSNNWHRRTRIPLAVLDNLNIGTHYFISYGLRDDRDRRVAPTVAAGNYFEGAAINGAGGGGFPQKICAHSKYVF